MIWGFIQTLFLLVQLQAASILFVDNPVGAGFSYVDDCSMFAKNLSAVVSDMIVFLGEFFKSRTEFQVSQLNSRLELHFSLLLKRSQKELANRLPDGQCLLRGSMHLVGVSAGITTASYFSQFRSCILNSMLWDGLLSIVWSEKHVGSCWRSCFNTSPTNYTRVLWASYLQLQIRKISSVW